MREHGEVARRIGGFTLMEQLVVIGIMLILATVGTSNFIFSIKKSHDAARKSDLAAIAKGLEGFANDFGKYPEGDASGKILACDYSGTGLVACSPGSPMAAYLGIAPEGGVVTYLSVLPSDPVEGGEYFYQKTAGGFALYAALENTSDQSYKTGLSVACGAGITCNYQLTESGVN